MTTEDLDRLGKKIMEAFFYRDEISKYSDTELIDLYECLRWLKNINLLACRYIEKERLTRKART